LSFKTFNFLLPHEERRGREGMAVGLTEGRGEKEREEIFSAIKHRS